MAERKVVVEGDIVRIPLSGGMEAIADAADAELLGAFTWSAAKSGNNTYAVTRVNKKTVHMRTLLIKPPPKRRVKSLGDTLDCRRSQLALVDPSKPTESKFRTKMRHMRKLRWELLVNHGVDV